MQIYSIRDSKAEAYLQPFFATNEAVARRYVSTAVNTSGHEFSIHTEDYALFHIGSFSELSGTIHANDPRCVTLLVNLVEYEAPGVEQNGPTDPSPNG